MGNWIVARLKEPTTWKGLGWLLVAAGVAPVGSAEIIAVLGVQVAEGLIAAGVAVVGAVEIVRKEKP